MQEDIKKIAESLGLSNPVIVYIDKKPSVVIGAFGEVFNPYENSADAFMVLEKLISVCRKRELEFSFNIFSDAPFEIWIGANYFWADDLEYAVCTAYLSLIESK